MIALIKKNGDGTVLDHREDWCISPGEYFDGNFYICIISTTQEGKHPIQITKPGPSRPHASLIKIDQITKSYCESKNWEISGLEDFESFPRWRGTLTTPNVKEPSEEDIVWGNN